MYISLDHAVGYDPVGAQGLKDYMRTRGVLSAVFNILKCTPHLGIGLVNNVKKMDFSFGKAKTRATRAPTHTLLESTASIYSRSSGASTASTSR